MELVLNNKKTSVLDILIDFFAFQYDLAYDFGKYFVDYVKWIVEL
jgi:hypothetical protein